ncbi:hypothetical protein DL98DRAFT_631991, partial [Cadophora sp. DSE1049]
MVFTMVMGLVASTLAEPAATKIITLDIDGNPLETPIVVRKEFLEDRTVSSSRCNAADNCLKDLRHPLVVKAASKYCSALLQQTTTTTPTNTIGVTVLSTQTNTETTIITTTTTSTAPVTTFTSPVVCGLRGFGNSAFNIFQDDSGDLASQSACQNECLSRGALTFGFGVTTCACYNRRPEEFVSVNSGSPYTFFNVNCPPPPANKRAIVTPAPAATCINSKPLPSFFASGKYVGSRISSACSCLITNAPPACTKTVAAVTALSSTTVVATVSTTQTSISTEVMGDPGPTTTVFG